MTITGRVVRNARRRGLTVYTHRQWGSKHKTLYQLRRRWRPHGLIPKKPADTLWQHITVTVPTNDFKADARKVEDIGFERFDTGVSYNWLVDMDTGRICVGMPLDAKGAHTLNDKELAGYSFNQNYVSVAIAVIGMPGTPISLNAKNAICNLIAAMIDEKVLTTHFDYNPHSLVAFKDCPCDPTRDEMRDIKKGALKLYHR